MPGFSISYNGYEFSDNGRAHFLRQAKYEGDAIGARPKRAIVTYTVAQWFLEDTFAENQELYQAMLAAIRSAPEGRLLIKDENDTTLVDVTARPQDDNLPDQWGQHMTECTVAFQATEIISNSTVNATVSWTVPTTGSVTLLNVTGWREAVRTERPTFSINNRREAIGSVVASGKIVADPTQDETTRRTYLQGQRDAIGGAADHKQTTLAFGTFSQIVRIDTIDADIKDGSYELEWTLTAAYRRFPSGTYTETEYQVDARDERERSERITTVRGRIRANTLAAAQTKLAAITSTYLVGNRTLRRSDQSNQVMDGADDTTTNTPDAYNELSFTLEFREPLDILNWQLTVTDREDAKSGLLITTYSGRVTALIASNALDKARDLGAANYPITLASSEALTSSQIDGDQEQFVECVFSYEYARKGSLLYAEVSSETNDQTFAESTTVVSGFAVAATEDDAMALARSFKPDTGLQLSARETVHAVWGIDGIYPVRVFARVEFSYTFHAVPAGGAIEYEEQISKDYTSQLTMVTYSGTAIAETTGEADALIDAIVVDIGHVTKDERTHNWASADSDTILRSVTFSVSFVGPLASGDSILEAEVTLATTFSVDHAVFTQIPFGDPFVQPSCGVTPAVKEVTGSVRAVSLGTAQSWGRGKKSLSTAGGGYPEPDQERESTEYMPFDGATVKAYKFAFTYSGRFQRIDPP